MFVILTAPATPPKPPLNAPTLSKTVFEESAFTKRLPPALTLLLEPTRAKTVSFIFATFTEPPIPTSPPDTEPTVVSTVVLLLPVISIFWEDVLKLSS